MKCILAAAVLAAGQAAQAGGISFNEITPGEALRFQASTGQVLEHVFRGKSWGRYLVETYELDGDARAKLFDARFDSAGRLVEIRGTDGSKIRYAPHRCTDVIGTCSYEVILPGGSREARVQEMFEEGQRQSITLRDNTGRILSATEREVDARGWTLNSSVTAGGTSVTLTRISGG